MSGDIAFFTGVSIKREPQLIDPARFCADNLALGDLADAALRFWSTIHLARSFMDMRQFALAIKTISTLHVDFFGRRGAYEKLQRRADDMGFRLSEELRSRLGVPQGDIQVGRVSS